MSAVTPEAQADLVASSAAEPAVAPAGSPFRTAEDRSASRALPLALGLVTFAALWATQASVGFVRDEGYYFTAAQHHEAWLALLFRAPLEALSAQATERHWGYNAEHPGLTKLCFAASHYLFTTKLGWLPDAVSWRLPAFGFAGLLAYWLSVLGAQRSRAASVLAPLLFFCAERPFFYSHLACFDIPIAALHVGVGVAWARALGLIGGAPASRRDEVRRGLWLAFLYGLALATKHNAWLFPPVLIAHALLCPRELRGRGLRALPWLLTSPAILFAAWPLLWHNAYEHLRFWVEFHLKHVHYAWYFLGSLLRQPPFPVHYPETLLALTLPITTAALLAAALVRQLVDFARRNLVPLRLLELGFAVAALLPFMLTTTPIFGGTKHWLSAVAFLAPEAAGILCLIAASAAAAGRGSPAALRPAAGAAEAPARRLAWLTDRRALALGAVAALAPGLYQIVHTHPYGTSAYGELSGGIAGAASLGMQRQFWSNNVTAVLPWLNEHVPRGGRVWFHEVNHESYRTYQLMGMLRADIQYAAGPADSQYAAIQWHREFRNAEYEVWNHYGTQKASTGLWLDETPQVVVYVRKGMPGER